MSLLTNMSIERTSASMNASTNPAGYRYIGGDGINVDNEVYQITAKCDGNTILFNSEGQMTVSTALYAAGDNITISEDEHGQLTISAAMFQSQFQAGDRDRYELGLSDLNSVRMRVSSLEGRATAVEGRATTLETDLGIAEGNITSQGNRITTLENAQPGIDTRISDIEHDLNTTTTGLKDVVAGHTQSLIDHATDIGQLQQTVAGHTDFINEFSGLDSTLGGYGTQISDLQLDVQDLGSADTAIGLRIDGDEDRLDALELTVNGRTDDPNGEPDFAGHEQRIAGAERGILSTQNSISFIESRVLDLENAAGIGEGSGNSGIAGLRTDVDALQSDMTQAQSDIGDLQLAVTGAGEDANTAIGNAAQVAADLAEEIADRELDESTITDSISTLDGRVTDVAADASLALSRLSTLDNTTIPGINDAITQLNTDLSADISQNAADILQNTGDISDLAADITSINSGLTTIQGNIETNSTNIASNAQEIQNIQAAVAKKLMFGYNTLQASDINYQAVSAGTPYDDAQPYFVRNDYTYSPAYIAPSSVNVGDAYDGNKVYYIPTGEDTWTAYTYVDQETWESDVEAGGLTYYDQQVYLQDVPAGTVYDSGETYVTSDYQPYTYVDQETWETDLDAGTVYTTYMIPLYTESAGVYSAVSTSVPLDPNVTYYNQNEPTYSMIAAPEMEKVESSMIYRNDVNYYNKNLFGYYVYNEYAGGQSAWETDRDAGKVYMSPEWDEWTTDGVYEVNAAPEDSVAQINTQKDCYAIINSGIGNAMLISGTNLSINIPADPNGGVHVVTVPMAANETITVSATPGKRGTAVLGDIIIKTTV